LVPQEPIPAVRSFCIANMENGWIKLHRKMLEWEWFKEEKTLKLFLYFLLSANHENKNWKGIEVKRGQLITGIPSIVENTGLSAQSVRTSIIRLISTGEITNKSTNRFRLITITKYDFYQKEGFQPTGTSTGNLTDKQQTNNRQTTSTKNDKNDKNERIPPYSPPMGDGRLVIDLFKELNPSYKRLFLRRNQHEAGQRLWEREGYEKLKRVVQFLEFQREDRFCPQIYTPLQLEEKWGALVKYALGLKSQSINNKNNIAFV